MSEGKKIILEMLKQGRISEDEAIKLLESLKENAKQTTSKADDELAKLIESLTRNGKIIGKKTYNYVKNVDYKDLQNKASVVIDQIVSAIDDFRITRL